MKAHNLARNVLAGFGLAAGSIAVTLAVAASPQEQDNRAAAIGRLMDACCMPCRRKGLK